MKGYRKYFGKKLLWFLITLVFAVILNFVLPRLSVSTNNESQTIPPPLW